VGQFHEVEVDVPPGCLESMQVGQLAARFHRRHEELYTFSTPTRMAEVLTLRLKASLPHAPFHFEPRPMAAADASAAVKRSRTCWFGDEPTVSTIYEGARLEPGNVVPGPALIEEKTTTILVPPAFVASVDAYQNFILRKQP
jgi:N-methylhydantoinase A